MIAAHTEYILMSGIHPAGINRQVSGSLFGRTSQVKLFVWSIARSMLRCWSLRKRKQTAIYSSDNVQKQPNKRTKHCYCNVMCNRILIKNFLKQHYNFSLSYIEH